MDKIVHFEIPVDDLARAKAFYGSIFGWGLDDVPGMGAFADFKDPEGNTLGLWENA